MKYLDLQDQGDKQKAKAKKNKKKNKAKKASDIEDGDLDLTATANDIDLESSSIARSPESSTVSEAVKPVAFTPSPAQGLNPIQDALQINTSLKISFLHRSRNKEDWPMSH